MSFEGSCGRVVREAGVLHAIRSVVADGGINPVELPILAPEVVDRVLRSSTPGDGMKSNAETKSEARDDRLIVLLGEGRSYEAAAAMGDCSVKTIQRRMADPVFAQAVVDQRRERVSAIAGLLVGASERAVAVFIRRA